MFQDLLFLLRGCNHPPVNNLRDSFDDTLPEEGLPKGNNIEGAPSSGKTLWLTGHRIDYDTLHPRDASLALDKAGAYTDAYLAAALMRPEWPDLRRRIKYVRLGDPVYSTPLPLFSPLYGNTYEEQVQRVVKNFERLLGDAIEKNPTLIGNAVKSLLPNALRLLCTLAYVRPTHEPFQITELVPMIENKSLMTKAITKCGEALDYGTKQFLINRFINVKNEEANLRSYALTSISSDLDVQNGIGHLGANRPTIIPYEAIEKGWIVLVDGSNILHQQSLQDFLMTHIYSLFMEVITARKAYGNNNKFSLIIDEARAFLKTKGMADDVGEISQLWRSRGLIFYMVTQNPRGQLDESLLKNIWALGNQVIFKLQDKGDCADAAYQLTSYDPRSIKQEPRVITQNPTTEPERGQDRLVTDWISGFQSREVVIRRHLSESRPDPIIRHIRRTRDVPIINYQNDPNERKRLEDLKDELLRENALPVNDVIYSVSERLKELDIPKAKPKPVNT